jgi:hypothetical protein
MSCVFEPLWGSDSSENGLYRFDLERAGN